MDFSGCPDDDSLGPAVRGCRGDFDFTIKFEKIFFTLIPVSLFIALTLPRIIYLSRKPAIVAAPVLRIAKLAAISVFAILQLALVTLSSTKPGRFSAFFIPSDAVSLASGLCMLVLSSVEHSRSPRPSILLNAYLFVTILLDISQVRTLWLASTNVAEIAFSRVFTCGVAVKALIVVIESQSKSRWIVHWDLKSHSPEETTGLYGLGAYAWLNRLFLAGYSKVLHINDLFPLDRSMASELLHANLAHRVDVSRFRNKNHGLTLALAKALAVPLLLPVGPRIALGAFQFCQPFLTETLLNHLQRPANESSNNVGYGLIGATILIYVGIAASGAFYWYFQERAMYMARGLLASVIYRKTTESKITSAGDSAALTLMSTDVERIIAGCLNVHEFWANTIQVALACWLLSRQIGAAFVAPLIVVGFCVLCSAIVARYAGPRQKNWMEKIQKRVGLTSAAIGQMKHLKISGLAGAVESAIQSMRVDELGAAAHFRLLTIIAAVVGYLPLFLSPVVTFAFASRTLDVTTIFTSTSYLMLLAAPLGILFQMIPSLLAAFACLNRIQAFLEQEPRFDFREVPTPAGSTTCTASEKPPRVKISGGSFGWEPGKPSLKNIDLDIPASCLTIVVGPVASGKSTLCKALLGEVPVAQGRVLMASSSSRRVGYCDQTPYLSNSTIRENIVGFSPFHQQRYDEVIEATMLGPDLALLPQGDRTSVGSNGITLSGGQKQRVSMARALYLDTDFYVFDDILSGLDADTEEQVFLRVFSPAGLIRRRNATALLCTHSIRHLPSADHIVALGADGTIVEQGAFQELLADKKYIHSLGVERSDETNSGGSSTPARPSSANGKVVAPAPALDPVLSKSDEQARMTGDWAVYRYYFARINLIPRISFVVFGIGWGGLSNFGTIWLKFWSEDVASPAPSHSNAFYNGLYALFQTGTLACLFFSALACFTSMVTFSGSTLHREALRTLINAPLRFFTATDTGVVVNLFSQDMTVIDGQLPNALLNVALAIFECLGMAAVIATSSPYVALTYPFLAAVLYVLQKFYLRTSRQMRLLDLEAKSPLYSHFIDTMKGLSTHRALGWVQEGINKNYELLDVSQRPAYLLAMVQRWLAFSLELIIAVLALAVVTLATQLRSNTAFTGASLVTLMMFGQSLTEIIRFYTMLETSIGAISRLKAFSDNVEPENGVGEDMVPPKEWPTSGTIEINGVSASYSSGPANTASPDHLALENLHLTITPGEKIAVCGRSGSGKSSLLLLLLRLLDPLSPSVSASTANRTSTTSTSQHANQITIDGLPLSKISRRHLRQRLIALPQEPVFLPAGTSVRANLDPHGEASDGQCRAALEAVSLWPPPGVSNGRSSSSSPGSGGGGDDGGLEASALLNAPLDAETALSQGQRQLFSLARAILRRRLRADGLSASSSSPAVSGEDRLDCEKEGGEKVGRGGQDAAAEGGILLLDEVSSSVDKETDEQMQRVIMREFAGYTIVMVSHRLGMVMGFDRVLVMEAGRIVESGRPAELVETEGSRFRELWMVGNKGKRS